jgi:hypothetical protein
VAKFIPCLFVVIVAVSLSSPAQTHMPTMHGNVPHLNQQEPVLIPQQQTKPDPVKLQHEAQELLELSQSLQSDIDSVNRGVMPKDTIEKLKRVEKLAKHLRGELTP